jgi:hypothetical protein
MLPKIRLELPESGTVLKVLVRTWNTWYLKFFGFFIFNMNLKFLNWGSKNVQIFHFVLNPILEAFKSAPFSCRTEIEETILLNLYLEP